MFHLAAYFENVANGVTYSQVNAAFDQALTVNPQNRFVMPDRWRVCGAFVQGTDLTRAQIDAPSLRGLRLPEIYPTNVAATVGSRPPFVWYGPDGPQLAKEEGVAINVSKGGAAAADLWAGLWLTRGLTKVSTQGMFTMPFTATITAVNGSWVAGAITFDSDLQAGTYDVVGMNVVAANTIFARLIFPNQVPWRPGCIAVSALTNFIQPDYFGKGNMGKWGTFFSTAQPQLEIFGLAAGAAAPTGFLDLVKTG